MPSQNISRVTVKDGVKGSKLLQLQKPSNEWSLYDVILSQHLLCEIIGITIQYNTVQKALKLHSRVILVWPIFSGCFNPLESISNSYCWYTITILIQRINISVLIANFLWWICSRPQLTKCKKISQNYTVVVTLVNTPSPTTVDGNNWSKHLLVKPK